jgi:hypothetical protein
VEVRVLFWAPSLKKKVRFCGPFLFLKQCQRRSAQAVANTIGERQGIVKTSMA